MSVPKTMRAIQIKDGKGPSSSLFIDENVNVPLLNEKGGEDHPGGHHGESAAKILVKVKAFGLNRMDILQREGKYPLPPGTCTILGVEFSGTVADAGSQAEFKVGDEVFGLATGGAYAEYIAVPSKMVLHKPKELSWEQSAAIPENFLTAFQALTRLSNLEKGQDALIHAGASGVGLAAIQIARAIGAKDVYVTAGSSEKCDFCKSIGATEGINYKACDWQTELAKLTKEQGVDVIMDFIGAPYFGPNLASLKRDGRLVMQGGMGGTKVKEVDVGAIIYKRLKIEGSTLRSRSLEYQSSLVQEFVKFGGLEMIVNGVKSENKDDQGHHLAIHKVFSWKDIKAAHDEMEANKNTGKIVVTID